jgi:hypothetical protein
MTDKNDNTSITLTGALYYPKLVIPDTKFEAKWYVDLFLKGENLEKAKKNALRVKTHKLGKDAVEGYDGEYVRIERKVRNYKGEESQRPPVKNSTLQEVPLDIVKVLGNGTIAKVKFLKATKRKGGATMSPAEAMSEYGGYGMYLQGVQILDLVVYRREGDPENDFVVEPSGYRFEDGENVDSFEDDIPTFD